MWIYVCEQIQTKVGLVQKTQEELKKTWDDQKDYHDKMYGLHTFLRDAQQLDTISSSQEVGHPVHLKI